MAHDHPHAAATAPATAGGCATTDGFEVAVLLGRGMPLGEQKRSLPEMGHALVEGGYVPRFVVAYAEMSEPPLESVLAGLAAEGVRNVVVLPVIVPFDRNLRGWISRWLSTWCHDHPSGIRVVLADAPGSADGLMALLVSQLESARGAADIREAARPLKIKAGASKIPDVARMVMVCLGPRCAQAGGFQIFDQLRQRFGHMRSIIAEDEDEVLVIRTNCQGPCNFAPLIAVQPENIWYGGLTVPAINRITERHLIHGGAPVAPWALRPGERLRRPDGELAEPDLPFAAESQGDIQISGLFMRNAMSEDRALAAFMELANHGDLEDELIAVHCAASPRIAIHDASDDHDHDHDGHDHDHIAAKAHSHDHSHSGPLVHFHSHDHDDLQNGEGIPLTIPAQTRVLLQPGKLHMMLLDLKELPDAGTTMPLSLEFRRAGRVEVNVWVHPPP